MDKTSSIRSAIDLEQRRDVFVHCGFTHSQLRSDSFGRKTISDQTQHEQLARRKALQGGTSGSTSTFVLKELTSSPI
jgi:hypothetical protein